MLSPSLSSGLHNAHADWLESRRLYQTKGNKEWQPWQAVYITTYWSLWQYEKQKEINANRFFGQKSELEFLKQSMGARNRVGKGLLYQRAGLHSLAEFIYWNQFLGSINV
jgi:hypothetical protein